MTKTEREAVDFIVAAVCDEYGVSVADVHQKLRGKKAVSDARYVAMWLISEHMDATVSDIAEYMGRHHATVIYGLGQVEFRILSYKIQQKVVRRLSGDVKEFIDAL